jgi:hypothetical protein
MIDLTKLKTAEQKAVEKTQQKLEQTEAARKNAYTQEADPLFFKWQAGEATQAEWQAKRDEIRQRFPKE